MGDKLIFNFKLSVFEFVNRSAVADTSQQNTAQYTLGASNIARSIKDVQCLILFSVFQMSELILDNLNKVPTHFPNWR